MSPVRPRTVAVWRMLRATAHVVRGIWIIRTRFDRQSPEQTEATVAQWSRDMLRIMGVQLEVRGQAPAAGPCLVVANHISWLDILVINAAQPVRFVSKADVLRWPLLGSLVAGAGTLFIERERKRDALRVVHQCAEALQRGETVAVFPEGTTGSGPELLPFHANLLQSAVSVDAPLQPLALRYSLPNERHAQAAAYVGEMTLVASLWQVVSNKNLRADLQILPAIESQAMDRRALAEMARAAIQQAI